MTFSNDAMSVKESIELVKDIRIAICGNLQSSCKHLRDAGVSHIDKYDDALNLSFALRKGEKYHLILVYAPQGEGLNVYLPYKIRFEEEWKKVPVKLMNEPACHAALVDLVTSVRSIAKKQTES